MRAKPLTQTGITSTSSGVLYYVDNYQRIHQLFWGGSQWLDADLMSSSGSGYNVAPGSGVAVDANGILYYADTSGDVHQMYWGGAKFMDADLMASSGSGVKAQAGTGSSVDANGNVYYVSTGQTVHQMWWGGTQMMDADLMASSGSGVQVDSATEITLDSDATIYYVSTDGAVHKMYWGGSNFLDTRLMSVSSQPNSRAESGTGVAIDSNLNVYYVDTAQTVHQMLWNGSEFADSNLMSSSGSGMLVSLGTQPWVDSSGNVYYVDTSQNIHKMYWGGSQWLDTNLMSSSGIGYLAQGDSEGAVDGSGNVYYISMNQNIYQMFWNGTQYQDINLMASSGSGVLAAGSFTISGVVTDGGSGLPGVTISLAGGRSFLTATDSNGNYSFAVPAGGGYTVTPAFGVYTFAPSSQSLSNDYANQTANFSVATSVSAQPPGSPGPQSPPPPTDPPPVVPPAVATAYAANCNDISGPWTDSTGENSYSLSQAGNTVSGTVVTTEPGCGQFSSSVQGSVTGLGAFALNLTAPATDACGIPLTPNTATENVTLSGCSQAQVSVTSGSTGFSGSGGSGGTVTWSRTSSPPGVTLSVDLLNGTAATVLSGQNKAATLSVQITGDSGTATLASHPSATAGSSFPNDKLGRTTLPAGQYGSVTATWDTTSVTVPVAFNVIGNTRFTQYNAPWESQCPSNPQPAWIVYKIDATLCYYKAASLAAQFQKQTSLNGYGLDQANELLAGYNTGAQTICDPAPRGTQDNTFFSVDSGGNKILRVTGDTNKILSDGTGATNPYYLNNNPKPATLAVVPKSPILSHGDQVMMVDQNDSPNSEIRVVEDLCPYCANLSGSPPGTVARIDAFTSTTNACSGVPDYGNRTAIRLR